MEVKTSKDKLIRNLISMIIMMSVCTIISKLFIYSHMSESNIVMIYLLGILLYSFLAEGYGYSIFATVCVVLLYNFFFAEPLYTLKVDNPDYVMTFLVMFSVGFITSMLTIRVKKERQLVEERETYISSLYHIERRLLNVKSIEDLAQASAEEIAKQLKTSVLVELSNHEGTRQYRKIVGEEVFNETKDRLAGLETYKLGGPCGHGTELFQEAKAYYTPILSHHGVLGIVGVALPGKRCLSKAQQVSIELIAPQIAVVLERERIYEKQQQTKIEIQSERLRADMLRSISHDFRTPLAGIMGSASTVLDNYERIEDGIKKNFLQSIYEDADWLNELVENILQTTRFDENKVQLNIGLEAAEEIVIEAVTHIKKHASAHKIVVKIPDDIIFVKVDGILIRQVLVNILNNAINYTPKGSEIRVSLTSENNHAIFEVCDEGPGITEEEATHIFERYYHKKNSEKNRQGMGLGLALCKSIIEAHQGEITISNNKPHGTIVRFYVLKNMEEK